MTKFLQFCKDHNALPDVISWHEGFMAPEHWPYPGAWIGNGSEIGTSMNLLYVDQPLHFLPA